MNCNFPKGYKQKKDREIFSVFSVSATGFDPIDLGRNQIN